MSGWTSVKSTSLREVVITGIAMFALAGVLYLRRGDVCLTQSIVIAVIFPFIVLYLDWRLNQIVWQDVWKRFKKPSDPVDRVIEGILTEAGLAFERLGPWQGTKSFKFEFQERYLLDNGSRITLREKDGLMVYLGPVTMEDEVETLKTLVDGVLV